MDALTKIEKEEFDKFKSNYVPQISVDCVIFGFDKKALTLKILLVKSIGQDSWGLPGGYIYQDENVDNAAKRVLNERTGAEDIFLKQFKVFGELHRSEDFFKDNKEITDPWFRQRFISIGYYALVNYRDVRIKVDVSSSMGKWNDIESLPPLIMDHRYIVEEALLSLRESLSISPIGYNLMPRKFTIPELQKLYEIILGRPLARENFYRKISNYGILTKLNEVKKGVAHKAPNLYSFNKEKYDEAVQNGLKDIW